MARKGTRRFTHDLQPPFPCFFKCGRILATKYDRKAIEGWEWFTGYGESPLHFCGPCRKTRQYEVDRIRERMNVKPDGYPEVTVSPFAAGGSLKETK